MIRTRDYSGATVGVPGCRCENGASAPWGGVLHLYELRPSTRGISSTELQVGQFKFFLFFNLKFVRLIRKVHQHIDFIQFCG